MGGTTRNGEGTKERRAGRNRLEDIWGKQKKRCFFFWGVGNFHHPLNGGWKIYYTLENQRFGSDAFSLSIGWIFKFQLLRVYYFHSPLYFQGFISLSPQSAAICNASIYISFAGQALDESQPNT